MVGEMLAGAVQGLGNVGIGIWNAYQQSKNYEYQKQLQQKIFEREDNALQRRVADAEKAGYNKFAVLGQGSGAGSVVSTTAPQIDENLGSRAADALQHTYQLAVERNSAKIAEENAEKAKSEKNMTANAELVSNWQTAMSIAGMMRDAGFQFDNFVIENPYQKKRPGIAWTGNPAYPGAEMSKSNDGSLFNLEYDSNYYGTRAAVEQNKITGDWAHVSNVIKILQGIFGTVRDVGSAYRSFRGNPKK